MSTIAKTSGSPVRHHETIDTRCGLIEFRAKGAAAALTEMHNDVTDAITSNKDDHYDVTVTTFTHAITLLEDRWTLTWTATLQLVPMAGYEYPSTVGDPLVFAG